MNAVTIDYLVVATWFVIVLVSLCKYDQILRARFRVPRVVIS